MKKTYKLPVFLLGVLASILAVGCALAPGFSDTPYIEFVSFDDTEMNQFGGAPNSDSIFLTLYFEDGDGDLGIEGIGTPNIRFIDNRTGQETEKFTMPMIPTEGAGNGVSGEIKLKLYNTCCVFPDNIIDPCEAPPQYPTNDLSFKIVMEDRAGNISDTITTPPIILRCN